MKKYNTTDYLNIGKIVNTQGIKGEVRVIASTDFPKERFQVGNELLLFMSNESQPLSLQIESHRTHKNFNIIKFAGYDSINAVEVFRDGILKVASDNLIALNKDEYYYFQIIGLDVVDETRGNLGKVKEILSPGANDVWVVTGGAYKEVLVPYIDSVVKKIDIENNQIEIDLPEGLID